MRVTRVTRLADRLPRQESDNGTAVIVVDEPQLFPDMGILKNLSACYAFVNLR
jgi:hypothetical protein